MGAHETMKAVSLARECRADEPHPESQATCYTGQRRDGEMARLPRLSLERVLRRLFMPRSMSPIILTIDRRIPGRAPSKRVGHGSLRGEWAHFLRISFLHPQFFCIYSSLLFAPSTFSPLAPLSMQIGSLSMYMQSTLTRGHMRTYASALVGNQCTLPIPSTSAPPPEAFAAPFAAASLLRYSSDCPPMSVDPPVGLR